MGHSFNTPKSSQQGGSLLSQLTAKVMQLRALDAGRQAVQMEQPEQVELFRRYKAPELRLQKDVGMRPAPRILPQIPDRAEVNTRLYPEKENSASLCDYRRAALDELDDALHALGSDEQGRVQQHVVEQHVSLVRNAASAFEIVRAMHFFDAIMEEASSLGQLPGAQHASLFAQRLLQLRKQNADLDQQLQGVGQVLAERSSYCFDQGRLQTLSPEDEERRKQTSSRISALRLEVGNLSRQLEQLQKSVKGADVLNRYRSRLLSQVNLKTELPLQQKLHSQALQQFPLAQRIAALLDELHGLRQLAFFQQRKARLAVLLLDQAQEKELKRRVRASVLAKSAQRVQELEEVKDNEMVKRVLLGEEALLKKMKSCHKAEKMVRLERLIGEYSADYIHPKREVLAEIAAMSDDQSEASQQD